jgi:plastocyanin
MQFKTLSVLSFVAGLASAANHDVMVGQSGLTFSPNNLTAAQGDTVTFHYYPKAHSVVQAAFASPCQPLSGGFFSGFVPSSTGEANMTFVITVNSTKPIWYYCSQGMHCQAGMVGVINEK